MRKGRTKELYDLFAQAFKRAAEHAMTQCLNGDLSKILEVVGFERSAQFLGLPSPTADQNLDQIYGRCLRFEVDYDFEGTYPESGVDLHVRAHDVPLTVRSDPTRILILAAEQPLEYVTYTERRYCVDALTPVQPFRITKVELDLSGRAEPRFMVVHLDPGEATETVKDCPGDGEAVYAPKHWYNGAFAGSNYDLAIGEGLYRFARFDFPDPPYARMETSRSVTGCEINKTRCTTPPYCDFNPSSGQLQEDCTGKTTLVFEHDPQR